MNKQSNITTALAAALCVAAFSATFRRRRTSNDTQA